jgi:hypothetical protein
VAPKASGRLPVDNAVSPLLAMTTATKSAAIFFLNMFFYRLSFGSFLLGASDVI